MPGWKAPSPLKHDLTRVDCRLGRALAAIALITLATAGCGPDGPDAPGALLPGTAVQLMATEFSFTPDDLVVEEGAYAGEIVNDGKIAHNITFEGGASFDVAPGETVRIDFDVPEGGVTFVCNIAGHAEAGMTGEVRTV